jgi:hypothetical protein
MGRSGPSLLPEVTGMGRRMHVSTLPVGGNSQVGHKRASSPRNRLVARWRATMPARWVAASFLATEKNSRRIMGYRDLWALKAILRGQQQSKAKVAQNAFACRLHLQLSSGHHRSFECLLLNCTHKFGQQSVNLAAVAVPSRIKFGHHQTPSFRAGEEHPQRFRRVAETQTP